MLKIVRSPSSEVCCAVFCLRNYFSCVYTEELSNPESRKHILQDFDRQFVRLKRNFLAGKDTNEWGVPYTRKEVALTPAIPSVEETRSEVSTIEQEADTATITGNHFANHYR